MAIDFNELNQRIMEILVDIFPKLLLSFVVLVVGWISINLFVSIFKRFLKKKNLEESLRLFLGSLIGMTLKVLLLIAIISILGVATTSFIALLGAFGIAVGLALQGGLSNLAGGVLILIFKPFKVNDFIETQGIFATVQKIDIFHTVLKTADGLIMYMPNGPLANSTITNFSIIKKRRVNTTFGISYTDDIKKAKRIIEKIISKDKRFHTEPAPFVKVTELADSSVNIQVRVWSDASQYWDAYYDLIQTVKLEFDKNNITIPFPQKEIHMIKK